MPKPYPREFREDVIRVARNREPGVMLKTIAADFGISESCLANWFKTACVEEGLKHGTSADEGVQYAHQRSGSGSSNREARCCAGPAHPKSSSPP